MNDGDDVFYQLLWPDHTVAVVEARHDTVTENEEERIT
jgi:hypothetical protein